MSNAETTNTIEPQTTEAPAKVVTTAEALANIERKRNAKAHAEAQRRQAEIAARAREEKRIEHRALVQRWGGMIAATMQKKNAR